MLPSPFASAATDLCWNSPIRSWLIDAIDRPANSLNIVVLQLAVHEFSRNCVYSCV